MGYVPPRSILSEVPLNHDTSTRYFHQTLYHCAQILSTLDPLNEMCAIVIGDVEFWRVHRPTSHTIPQTPTHPTLTAKTQTLFLPNRSTEWQTGDLRSATMASCTSLRSIPPPTLYTSNHQIHPQLTASESTPLLPKKRRHTTPHRVRSRGTVCVRTPCGVSPAFFPRKPISTAFSLINVPGICALSYAYLQMRIDSDRHPRSVGERGVASVFVP
jgi:hypothetical protein